MKYVDLVIDNKSNQTDQLYTYGCEFEDIRVGQKVYVHFARGKREREAYVFAVHDRIEKTYKNLKYVLRIDDEVSLTEEMIDTICWMKRRYLCRFIDAIQMFTPAGKPSKRGKIRKPMTDVTEETVHIEKLTEEQEAVLSQWEEAKARGRRLFLLHGVTGSGKTEVYMQIIERCIKDGKNVIMLVPEISLTKQIIERFAYRFGTEQLAILHSGLSAGERYDEWQRIRSGSVHIVVGARSAVFAPMENIGAVLLDEEHEATYKSDMTPKYDTIEVAIKRAGACDGFVLAGSATPSVATYERAKEGIYELLSMTKRYNEVELPAIDVVDMRRELRRGNTSVISAALREEMRETLAAGKQVILLLNRRGYHTYLTCDTCGEVVRCPVCGISMTYHKSTDRCVCHYCGRSIRPPRDCPSCGSEHMRFSGSGTEQVEELVQELFPEYPAARLDLDTMRKKGALKKILNDFSKGKTKILTGTQVVAKGLDFPNVGLVGILSADVSLNIPDFRSPERTFALVTQAAGRAGRGSEKGKVIIQTSEPDHYAIVCAAKQDYEDFFRREIAVRKLLAYPPYSDLIQVVFAGMDEAKVAAGANDWEARLRQMMGEKERRNITAPQKIDLFLEKGVSKYYLVIKCKQGMRKYYMGALQKIKQDTGAMAPEYTATVDVNPYSLGKG